MRCGDYGRLIAWVCGEVSEAERARIEAHLEECAACRREAGELEALIHLMQTDESVEAPPEVRAAVLRLFETSRGATASGIRRWIASLIRDTWARPVVAGVRGQGEAARQMLYRGGGYEIVLALEPIAGRRVRLIGQILPLSDRPEEVAGREVSLRRGREPIARGRTNHLGEFEFAAIPEGIYQWEIRLEGEEVWIPQLDVRTRARH
jgi:anti-sigma factor RsiW